MQCSMVVLAGPADIEFFRHITAHLKRTAHFQFSEIASPCACRRYAATELLFRYCSRHAGHRINLNDLDPAQQTNHGRSCPWRGRARLGRDGDGSGGDQTLATLSLRVYGQYQECFIRSFWRGRVESNDRISY